MFGKQHEIPGCPFLHEKCIKEIFAQIFEDNFNLE